MDCPCDTCDLLNECSGACFEYMAWFDGDYPEDDWFECARCCDEYEYDGTEFEYEGDVYCYRCGEDVKNELYLDLEPGLRFVVESLEIREE